MTDQSASPGGGIRIAVADAGPLIHLDELECIELLADFSEIRVPDAVWHEVQRHRQPVLRNTAIALVRYSASVSVAVDALAAIYTLHAGEREALNLCLDLSGALLLTDDTAARLAAKTLSIEAHGTLGLLLRAIRRRQLSKERVLYLLHQIPGRSTLHIRPGLLTEIIQQVAATSEP